MPDYLIGTMIELPRAALRAGEIAETAEFFSFGTNDLTQTTLGVSRDDAGMFLNEYLNKGVIARDPFVSIDVDGVGELIRIAAEARTPDTRNNLKLGICGEHGGDPDSIRFCHDIGTRLCFLLAISRAGGASGGGAGGAGATCVKKSDAYTDDAGKPWMFSWFMTLLSDL